MNSIYIRGYNIISIFLFLVLFTPVLLLFNFFLDLGNFVILQNIFLFVMACLTRLNYLSLANWGSLFSPTTNLSHFRLPAVASSLLSLFVYAGGLIISNYLLLTGVSPVIAILVIILTVIIQAFLSHYLLAGFMSLMWSRCRPGEEKPKPVGWSF